MEAIIRTNDRNLFDSLLSFLKSLHIAVETKEEKKPLTKKKKNKKYPLSGSVIRYDDPFGSATDNSDWEAAK